MSRSPVSPAEPSAVPLDRIRQYRVAELKKLLRRLKTRDLPDAELGRQVGLGRPTVTRIRRSMVEAGEIRDDRERVVERGGQRYRMKLKDAPKPKRRKR